jgi:hypothetical protein
VSQPVDVFFVSVELVVTLFIGYVNADEQACSHPENEAEDINSCVTGMFGHAPGKNPDEMGDHRDRWIADNVKVKQIV